MIYHKFVLFSEFKYIFLTMQLKFNRQKSLKDSLLQKLLKLIVFVGLFIAIVFLLEKINFSKPEKEFNTDITNEIIRLK